MSEATTASLNLYASDAAGQRKYAFKFSRSARVRELLAALIPRMGLSTRDSSGRPLDYQAFSKRDGMHLRGTDSVGEMLREGDELAIVPDIQAG